MCQGTHPSLGKHGRSNVHALTGQGQEQTQHLAPVALVLLGGGHGGVTADAALPYGIGDLGVAVQLAWNSKVREKEQVYQGVDEFFGQWPGVFKLFRLAGCFMLIALGLIEENLVGYGGPASFPPASPPKEAFFPRGQTFALI